MGVHVYTSHVYIDLLLPATPRVSIRIYLLSNKLQLFGRPGHIFSACSRFGAGTSDGSPYPNQPEYVKLSTLIIITLCFFMYITRAMNKQTKLEPLDSCNSYSGVLCLRTIFLSMEGLRVEILYSHISSLRVRNLR